jgi:hypothetical protein
MIKNFLGILSLEILYLPRARSCNRYMRALAKLRWGKEVEVAWWTLWMKFRPHVLRADQENEQRWFGGRKEERSGESSIFITIASSQSQDQNEISTLTNENMVSSCGWISDCESGYYFGIFTDMQVRIHPRPVVLVDGQTCSPCEYQNCPSILGSKIAEVDSEPQKSYARVLWPWKTL